MKLCDGATGIVLESIDGTTWTTQGTIGSVTRPGMDQMRRAANARGYRHVQFVTWDDLDAEWRKVTGIHLPRHCWQRLT